MTPIDYFFDFKLQTTISFTFVIFLQPLTLYLQLIWSFLIEIPSIICGLIQLVFDITLFILESSVSSVISLCLSHGTNYLSTKFLFG